MNTTLSAILARNPGMVGFTNLPVGTKLTSRDDGTVATVIGHYADRTIIAWTYHDRVITDALTDNGMSYDEQSVSDWYPPKTGPIGVIETLNNHENTLAVDLIVDLARNNYAKITAVKNIRTLADATLTDAKNAYEIIADAGLRPQYDRA